jgi:hypothetical protein
MLASQFDVDALIFTSIACARGAVIWPIGNVSLIVNAPAKRFRHSTVDDGDSIVTSAAASPEH